MAIERSGFLEEINLSGCNLGSRTDDLSALGKAFSGTNKLRTLNLSENNFSDVSASSWHEFCKFLRHCGYLQGLLLLKIGSHQPEMIPDLASAVAQMQHLTRFSLSHTPVSDKSDHAAERPAELRKQMTLSDAIAYKELFMAFQHCKMLRYLTLAHCNIQSAFQSLAEVVPGLHFLKNIDISGNNLAGVSEVSWEHFFENETKCLKHINFASCKLNPKHLSIIAVSLKNCCNLETLNMSQNDFSGEHIAFCDEVANFRWIKALYMSGCGLKDRMLQELLEATVHMERLRILDISRNAVSHDCLPVLKKAFKSKEYWQKILLSECLAAKDAPQFIKCFTMALESPASQIEVLDVSKNHLDSCSSEQWKNFVHQLSACFFLSKLDISSNELNHDKFRVFLDGRRNQCFLNLRSLRCHGNRFQSIHKHADYQDALKAFPALTMVDDQPIDKLQKDTLSTSN